MNPFTQRTIEIITNIPPGKVMTYGQIAQLAGSPKAARQVVRILHSMSRKYALPWHRVVNAKGEISFMNQDAATIQKMSLEGEGVIFSSEWGIELGKYQFVPI